MARRWHLILRRCAPVFILAAVVTSGCAVQPNDSTLPGQTAVGDDGYSVKVHFDHIENLVPNSTVQKDNVVIGTVASIDTQGWEAVAELRLLRDVPLPADSVFSIGQKTLLGAQYVEVVGPPDPPRRDAAAPRAVTMLGDGDVVPVEQTGTYPSTEQVLGAVALLLNDGGLSQISTITGEMSTALDGRVPDTQGLVRRANDLLEILSANRAEIVTALDSLERLSAGLRRDRFEIVGAIDRITPGLRVLERERERLVASVTRTGRTGDRAVRLVRASERALLANLDALGPILTNLGRASESLPEALKIGLTIPFPAMTTQQAVRGDYANLFATIDLRAASLRDSWYGGVPPALQAGDPVDGPLSPPEGRRTPSPDPGSGPRVDVPDGLEDFLGGLSGAGTSAREDNCSLLRLGAC